MDWIERWFGFSPDDGDGTAEWLIVLALLVVGVVVLSWILTRRKSAVFRLMTALGLARSSPPGS